MAPTIAITTFKINELVSEMFNLFNNVAEKKGLVMQVYENPEVIVQADCDKVKQIITNILNNSFKFTISGEVNISSVVDEDNVKIYITDTGIGIKKEDQGLLFGKFQQIGRNNLNQQGTGLGLHLSREIVRKMGGELWLEKSEEGKGSVFAFSIPLADSEKADMVKKDLSREALAHPDQKSDNIVVS